MSEHNPSPIKFDRKQLYLSDEISKSHASTVHTKLDALLQTLPPLINKPHTARITPFTELKR